MKFRLNFSNTFLFASAALGLSGCIIDFNTNGGNGEKFSCTIDDDCSAGFECKVGVCEKKPPPGQIPTCVDADNDGYGVGTAEERQTCRECATNGRCDEDCNDADASVHPNAAERCNGADDNCNEDIDEPTSCVDDASICVQMQQSIPSGTQVACNQTSGVCEVTMSTQFCVNGANPCPCNALPVQCGGGAYPTIPAPSECLQ
jgi:hypothetical protein